MKICNACNHCGTLEEKTMYCVVFKFYCTKHERVIDNPDDICDDFSLKDCLKFLVDCGIYNVDGTLRKEYK